MKLGELSERYESNGDPGCISDGYGDAGGKSYGAYQFANNAGIPQDFVEWLVEQEHEFGRRLTQVFPGSREFDAVWVKLAEDYPDEFAALQHDYVKEAYYEPARVFMLDIGYDIDRHSEAIRQVVWSAAVQYGPGMVVDLFQEAGGGEPRQYDDGTLISYIYRIRASDDWTAGSPSLRPGLRARFSAECAEALALVGAS